MVAIELQLISFALVVLLNSMSSVVNILAVLVRHILYSDRRWVFPAINLFNIIIECLALLPIPMI